HQRNVSIKVFVCLTASVFAPQRAQRYYAGAGHRWQFAASVAVFLSASWRTEMTTKPKSEMLSRRQALSLLGLAGATVYAIPMVLTVSDAKAGAEIRVRTRR